SHQKAYQQIVASGRPAIILEDDITLRRGFKEFAAGCEGLKDLALYHLGGLEGIVESELFVTGEETPPVIVGKSEFRRVVGAHDYLLRACAYALTPATARSLMRGFADRFVMADHWGSWAELAGLQDLYICPLVRHPRYSTASDIELGRVLSRS